MQEGGPPVVDGSVLLEQNLTTSSRKKGTF